MLLRSTPRRILVLGFVVVAALIAGIGVWQCHSIVHAPQITRENAERVKVGMTLDEVESILGGPPRDESTGAVALEPTPYDDWPIIIPSAWGAGDSTYKQWVSDSVLVGIWLEEGIVSSDIQRLPLHPVPRESIITLARRWLGF